MHQRHREKYGEAANDPTDHGKIQQLRDQRQRQKNNCEPGQNFRATRPAKIQITVVNPDAQQDDLDRVPPASEPRLNQV